MQTLPALRLTAALNALAGEPPWLDAPESAARDSGAAGSGAARARAGEPGEMWVRSVVGPEVAHHVVDPEDLLGTHGESPSLGAVLPALRSLEPELWMLSLPVPGAMGGLRGPKELNLAALDQGSAVVATHAGLALVPYRVGPAVQWRAFPAERPLLPPSPYDAERELSESVLSAAAALQQLDVAAGSRPQDHGLRLPSAYPNRQRLAADRAARLFAACEAALADDGASLSSYEADVRARELRMVREAARIALCAAVTWRRTPDETPGRRISARRGELAN